ncbi:RNA polymerase sigma factor [Zhouia sp. PK063]|uniref:RNA polymerase sigma factor n=1 Tax=Zhouia sp. PK063 TaxID=3373602 RepID=UPI0037AE396F
MSKREKEHLVSHAVHKYGEKLLAFIKPKVKNDEDAEDILQEVWYQFSNLTNISQIVNVGSWLYAVTRNKITDNYRKKRTEKLDDFDTDDEFDSFSIKEILLADEDDSPELSFFQEEIWNELFEALNELPEKQRSVFIANEIDNKTLKQIADEQQVSIKTIISRKQYATKHLRTRLKQLYDDLNDN